MKENIRNKVIKMNKNGAGYKKIAGALGISVGSVRNILADEKETSYCEYCGKKITLTPGKKAKKFCDDICRYKYWNEKRRADKR